jgi:hypothetical protein
MASGTRSPFPGMDPWLEHPAWWPNVHQRMITYMSDTLQSLVGDRYFVAIGERVYVEAPEHSYYPDVSIVEQRGGRNVVTSVGADIPVVVIVEAVEHREVFLEISDAVSGEHVVTVIEVLSPANKRPGPGRDLYLRKQAEILNSTTSLVEIDLLRDGEPTVAVPGHRRAESAYGVVVSPVMDRFRRELYPIRLFDRLPRVTIPLKEGDQPAVLDLQAVLDETYDKGGFGRRIDYNRPPVPPLGASDQAAALQLLAARA